MSAEEVCGAKALSTELFDSGQVVTGVWHLPSMLTRDTVEDDLLDALSESGHPVLMAIAETEEFEDYHSALDQRTVPVWLVDVEDPNGDVISGVGDTFGEAVAAARLMLEGGDMALWATERSVADDGTVQWGESYLAQPSGPWSSGLPEVARRRSAGNRWAPAGDVLALALLLGRAVWP